MKINDICTYDNSELTALKVSDGNKEAMPVKGDILEGTVSELGASTKILFDDSREIKLPGGSIRDTYVGDRRRFEVVEATSDKLVLKDLGRVGSDIAARGMMFTDVSTANLGNMVEDFSETMGDKEKDDTSSLERISDEDYSELHREGFSIEDFKAERLIRALARIKSGRAAKEEQLKSAVENVKKQRENISKQAAAQAVRAYEGDRMNMIIIEALKTADLPVTEANIDALNLTVTMSREAEAMNADSYAYLIKNNLEPTVRNIYRAVYSGEARRTALAETDWIAIGASAKEIINTANADLETGSAATLEDARQMMEYGIALTADNVVYRKELEQLKSDGVNEDFVARAAADAINEGLEAEDALLIGRRTRPEGFDIEASQTRLVLEELRLSMLLETGGAVGDIRIDIESLEKEIAELRQDVAEYYRGLAAEVGIPAEETDGAAELALETGRAVRLIGEAPVTLYGRIYESRLSISLAEIADNAAVDVSQLLQSGIAGKSVQSGIAVETVQPGAAGIIRIQAQESYEASSTQIRPDLGDSLAKAFRNVDSLLEENGFELTEANRRAVRILGRNSMEITSENINGIKYFDAELSGLVERMKPATVMTMIRRGINPLEESIDSLTDILETIEREEGVSPEERFSTFLVRMDESNSLTEGEREAYIGIYRLLYRINKDTGAAIGAAVKSGRRLTLGNLLTESRTLHSDGIDESIDDNAEIYSGHYSNSISAQIENGIADTVRYYRAIASRLYNITDPGKWQQAAEAEELYGLTPEELAERFDTDKNRQDISGTAPNPSGGINDAGYLTAQADAVRSFAEADPGIRRFLKSFGAKDSIRNVRAMENDGNVEIFGTQELTEKLTGPEEMESYYLDRLKNLREGAENLLTETVSGSEAEAITAQLDRFGLLETLGRGGHYEFTVNNDAPARVTMTFIHNADNAGRLNLEVSTASCHVIADLRFFASGTGGRFGRITGTVNCDSRQNEEAVAAPLAEFKEKMENAGWSTEGIRSGAERSNATVYFARLGEIKSRAADEASQPGQTGTEDTAGNERPETAMLYRAAGYFVNAFLQ